LSDFSELWSWGVTASQRAVRTTRQSWAGRILASLLCQEHRPKLLLCGDGKELPEFLKKLQIGVSSCREAGLDYKYLLIAQKLLVHLDDGSGR